MAEYGSQSTQLSAPQGAGANVVAPVRQEATPGGNSLFMSVAGKFIETVGGMVQKGDPAKDRENALKTELSQGYASLTKKLANQEISSAEFGIQAGALKNRIFGQGGSIINDLAAIVNTFEKHTEAGRVSDIEQAQRDARKADIADLQKSGGTVFPGQSEKSLDAAIFAHKQKLMAQREFEETVKRNAEQRAQYGYDKQVETDLNRDAAKKTMTSIIKTHLPAFSTFADDLVAQVNTGKIKDPRQAQALLDSERNRYSSFLVSAGKEAPDLINPFKELFDRQAATYRDLLDPAKRTADLEAQVKELKLKGELMFLPDPKFLAYYGYSSLMGPNATVALGAGVEGLNTILKNQIAKVSGSPAEGFNPVGDKSEVKLYEFLNSAVNTAIDPKKGTAERKKEYKDHVSNILSGVQETWNRGEATPKKLGEVAKFFAGDGFKKAVQEGLVDQASVDMASRIFADAYNKVIIQQVKPKLEEEYLMQNNRMTLGKVKDLVDIRFNGDRISIARKPGAAKNPEHEYAQTKLLNSLKPYEAALTQMVRIQTHLQMSTDYASTWADIVAMDLEGTGIKAPAAKESKTKARERAAPRSFPTEKEALADIKSFVEGTDGTPKMTPEQMKKSREMDVQSIKRELANPKLSDFARRILEQELRKYE